MASNIYIKNIGIVLFLAVLFLSHIFILEELNSGFMEYNRIYITFVFPLTLLLTSTFYFPWRSIQIKVSRISLFLFFLALYIFFQLCIIGLLSQYTAIVIFIFPLLFIFFQQTYQQFQSKYTLAFLIASLLITFLYQGQLHPFSIFSTMKMNVPINSGSNANYFASLIPFTLGIYFQASPQRTGKIIKLLALVLFIFCIITIFNSHARLAYVSIIIGLGYSLYKIILPEKMKLRINKRYIWITCALLLLVLLYILYSINKESVHGRFLIYKISFNIIQENPIFGSGLGSFKSLYNNFQAVYFQSHKVSVPLQLLADDTFEPFNEILRILVELGIVGLSFVVIFVSISYRAIKMIKNPTPIQYGAIGSLLSIAVCCTLSYPLSLTSIIVNVFFFIAVFTAGMEPELISWNFSPHFSVRIALTICVCILSFHLIKKEIRYLESCYVWEKASFSALQGDFATAQPLYNKASDELRTNGKFLINFGSEQIIAGLSKEGILTLRKAENYLPCTTLYLYLGDGYSNLYNLHKAELAYKKAISMVPSKFMGKYKLMKLALKRNKTSEATNIAREILSYPVKIPSIEVDNIRFFASKVLGKHN